MIFISEWRPTYDTQVVCGHTVAAGQKACRLSIAVCRNDVACLPQAISAALKAPKQHTDKPSLLYRLWHRCFGRKPKKSSVPLNAGGRMQRRTARQETRLDCGHTVKAGSVVWESRLYTCQQEGSWSMALLAASVLVLNKRTADKQPDLVQTRRTAGTIYQYAPSNQPYR